MGKLALCSRAPYPPATILHFHSCNMVKNFLIKISDEPKASLE